MIAPQFFTAITTKAIIAITAATIAIIGSSEVDNAPNPIAAPPASAPVIPKAAPNAGNPTAIEAIIGIKAVNAIINPPITTKIVLIGPGKLPNAFPKNFSKGTSKSNSGFNPVAIAAPNSDIATLACCDAICCSSISSTVLLNVSEIVPLLFLATSPSSDKLKAPL